MLQFSIFFNFSYRHILQTYVDGLVDDIYDPIVRGGLEFIK